MLQRQISGESCVCVVSRLQVSSNIGALIIRIGFPLKGFLLKGSIRSTIRGIMQV